MSQCISEIKGVNNVPYVIIRGLLLVHHISITAGAGGLAAIPTFGLDIVEQVTTLGLDCDNTSDGDNN